MLSEQTGETMKPIDSSSSPVLIDLTSRVERRRQGAGEAPGAGEAVQFRRGETTFGRVYETTRQNVESARAARVAELKAQVQAGQYRPNLETVAERFLTDLMAGR